MKRILLIFLIFLSVFSCRAQEARELIPEEFTRLINLKKAKQTNNIRIKPTIATISAQKLRQSIDRDISVLSIPVEITNLSAQTISMNLAHEWYGGIWAPTDFYVAALVLDWEKKMVWEPRPAYQVGNLGEVNKTVLKPQESITVDVRLNWRGTGSVPTEPLIIESAGGKHTIKFLLFFRTDISEEYAVTENFSITINK